MRWISKILALIVLFASFSFADPILFRQTGSGSGTLDGVPFGNSTFVIRGTGNTADRVDFGDVFFIDLISASIDILGLPTLNFITPTRFFVNQGGQIVGFSRAGASGADLFNGPRNAAFATWDMLSSIGPIIGTGSLLQWGLSDVHTDAGILFFDRSQSGGVRATFEASVAAVPEPSSLLLLLGLGLLGLGGSVRRKQSS